MNILFYVLFIFEFSFEVLDLSTENVNSLEKQMMVVQMEK